MFLQKRRNNSTNGSFSVSASIEGLDDIIKSLNPKLAARATFRALNKVGALATTAVKRRIVELFTIRYSQLTVNNIKANIENQVFTIKAFGRRRHMSKSKYFKAVQGAHGVYVEIQRGKIEYISHAFIAKHTRGGTNVYVRSMTDRKRIIKMSSKTGKTYTSQLPIEASLGPSVAQLFNMPSSKKVISQIVKDNFRRIFSSQLNYELSQQLRSNIKRGQ